MGINTFLLLCLLFFLSPGSHALITGVGRTAGEHRCHHQGAGGRRSDRGDWWWVRTGGSGLGRIAGATPGPGRQGCRVEVKGVELGDTGVVRRPVVAARGDAIRGGGGSSLSLLMKGGLIGMRGSVGQAGGCCVIGRGAVGLGATTTAAAAAAAAAASAVMVAERRGGDWDRRRRRTERHDSIWRCYAQGKPHLLSWGEEELAEGEHAEMLPLLGSEESLSKNFPVKSYLESLTRDTDDGVPLLKAAQRYDSNDWYHMLMSIPSSRVLRRISSHLAAAFVWSVSVTFAYTRAPAFVKGLAIPSDVFGLLSGLLGILLAFRMNQSYDRFWEARGLWTCVAGNVRTIATTITTCPASSLDQDSRAATMRLLAAYPVALRQYLQGKKDYSEFKTLLSRSELDVLRKTHNFPLAVLHLLQQRVACLNYSPFDTNLYLCLQTPLRDLTHVIGQCERLVRTPVPLSYVRHTSRFLSVYTMALPFKLLCHIRGYLLPIAVLVVSWVLFAMEEIGHLIEEPFGAYVAEESRGRWSYFTKYFVGSVPRPVLLPLKRYCDSIRMDLIMLENGGEAAPSAASKPSKTAAAASPASSSSPPPSPSSRTHETAATHAMAAKSAHKTSSLGDGGDVSGKRESMDSLAGSAGSGVAV